ncbi:MAG: histidine phosphatase family protein [Candidatus Lokiarchaeota archaeon]|nr:histidine phosphatase family protein [Candidatus Lokiarchaeota archaeon]
MKNIYLIRHGQTNSSLENRLCGSRTDEPLNTNGFQQIKKLILFLKNYNPDSIYTSPLIRAK